MSRQARTVGDVRAGRDVSGTQGRGWIVAQRAGAGEKASSTRRSCSTVHHMNESRNLVPALSKGEEQQDDDPKIETHPNNARHVHSPSNLDTIGVKTDVPRRNVWLSLPLLSPHLHATSLVDLPR